VVTRAHRAAGAGTEHGSTAEYELEQAPGASAPSRILGHHVNGRENDDTCGWHYDCHEQAGDHGARSFRAKGRCGTRAGL
jgi:hypothetical protein